MSKVQHGEVLVSVDGVELHRGRDTSVSPLPLNADGFQIAIDAAVAGDPRSAWGWARRVLLGYGDSAGALEDCALEKLMGDGT